MIIILYSDKEAVEKEATVVLCCISFLGTFRLSLPQISLTHKFRTCFICRKIPDQFAKLISGGLAESAVDMQMAVLPVTLSLRANHHKTHLGASIEYQWVQ